MPILAGGPFLKDQDADNKGTGGGSDIMKAGTGNDDEGDPGKLIWSIVAVRPPSHTKVHYPRKEGRGQRGREGDGYLAQSE